MRSTVSNPVVFCYDGSEGAGRALGEARWLCHGRPALVICVWESAREDARGVPALSVPPGLIEDMDAEAERHARETARRGAAIVGGAQPVAVRADGSAGRAIVAYADACDAAAIVVGSRGRGGLSAAILGSVSRGVLDHAHRPVVVVPAE